MNTPDFEVHRAIVHYSNPSTGEAQVRIPSLLGAGQTVNIPTTGLTNSDGFWNVPSIGSSTFIAVSVDRTQFLWLTAIGVSGSGGDDPSNEPIGHEDRTGSLMSFNNSTRTFSIQPANGSYVVWCVGLRYEKSTTESVVLPDTTGLYYIYFDPQGVLQYRTSYFVWDQDCPTAYVYWNSATQRAEFFADERHGITMDWQTHEYLHRTRGAAYANGFDASNFDTSTKNGNTDAQAKLDIDNGTFFDEDLQVDVRHSLAPADNTWEQQLQGPARIPVFYRSGTGYVYDAPTDFPVKQGVTHPVYNSSSGGNWSTTELDANSYGIQWIVATNQLNYPVLSIMGQAQYANVGQAEAASWASMDLSGLPVVEIRVLYKIIFRATGSNTPGCYFDQIDDYRNALSNATSTAAAVVDHGNLTGLGDDDHPQYVKVAGDTMTGGLVVGGDLTYNNNAIIASNVSSTNIDHIWHDEAGNAWNFCSDTTYKAAGNSNIVAGSFSGGSFSGNGSGLSNVDAATFDGLNSDIFTRYSGSITTQNWNDYVNGTESAYHVVSNASGSNRPSAYAYGIEVAWSVASQGKFQLYSPHNGSSGNGLWWRSGWNTDYDPWVEIWTSGTDGSGSGLDADLLDGLDLHTGRNNEANKVVRTDGNGYIQAGWINTTSGATSSTISRIYASNDAYVRYVTPATFRSQIINGNAISPSSVTTSGNVEAQGNLVVTRPDALMLAGASDNNHKIYSVNAADTALPWSDGPVLVGHSGWGMYCEQENVWRMGLRGSNSNSGIRYGWYNCNLLVGSAPNDSLNTHTFRVQGNMYITSGIHQDDNGTINYFDAESKFRYESTSNDWSAQPVQLMSQYDIGIAVRSYNSDASTVQMRPASGLCYFQNHNDSAGVTLVAAGYNPSSMQYKQDIETWETPKSVGAAVGPEEVVDATSMVKSLRPVTYRMDRMHYLSVSPQSERRKEALKRLNVYRRSKGLKNFTSEELVHQCGRDCDGSQEEPCMFYRNWDRKNLGFIAEEAGAVSAHLTKEGKDGDNTLIDSTAVSATLVKAFQELEARITALEGS